MQVQGGFILGLDSDDEEVFDAQIEFIQQAGIPDSANLSLDGPPRDGHVRAPTCREPASGQGNWHQCDDSQLQAGNWIQGH